MISAFLGSLSILALYLDEQWPNTVFSAFPDFICVIVLIMILWPFKKNSQDEKVQNKCIQTPQDKK